MHKRQFRPDKHATRNRHYLSRYSYVSTRLHPGTNHACEYLAGQDCETRRLEAFERDGYKCVDCGKRVIWESGYPNSGHLAHGGNTKITRCWCLENLKTKCFTDHIIREHNREVKFGPAWTRKGAAA